MLTEELSCILVEQKALASRFLKRYVIIDLYLPKNIPDPNQLSLLLINDGQDLEEMHFSKLLNQLHESSQLRPLLCVGIHAGKDRKNEYGTAKVHDYAGRGAKAELYNQFVLKELLPFIHMEYAVDQFRQKGFCGFSLGGLTAFDITWHYPDIFTIAGVFSDSLWWRAKKLDENYNDETDRIMHQQVKKGMFKPGLRFYFTTGSLDEKADRNKNGVIDSIDDTLALIEELRAHGYDMVSDIEYLNYPDGRHDVATWGRAMPRFLLWAWAVPVPVN